MSTVTRFAGVGKRVASTVAFALLAMLLASALWEGGERRMRAAAVVPMPPVVEDDPMMARRLWARRSEIADLHRKAQIMKASGVAMLALGIVAPAKVVVGGMKSAMSGTFKRRSPLNTVAGWALDVVVLSWSPRDKFTVNDAVQGTLILGATGSGKSSGSGRTIALSFLRAGFGGLVLTAKADERAAWEQYCRDTGRAGDLVVFGPRESLRFNFLQYELSRKGAGAGHCENLVNLFATVLEVAERNSAGSGGREDEGYWKRANRQLMRNAVDLLVLATGQISIPELYKLVVSAPTSFEQIGSAEWKSKSFCFQCLADADKRSKSSRQEHDFAVVADYWMLEFPGLSDKTRSVIVSTFTSMIDVLNRGILRELFCAETNVTPDAALDGKIILIDLPVKEFAEIGQFAQVLWKYCWQRAVERRDVATNPRPVFLWADEAQHFVTSYDMQFQTTCRSSRVATVLLSQNVSNFYAGLGGSDKGRAEADSLFANLNTKIFHANSDPVTNQWASTMIGRTRQFFVNASNSRQAGDWMSSLLGFGGQQSTGGISEQMEFEIQPSLFTKFRTGGPGNGWLVDGLVLGSGKIFQETRRTWLLTAFGQKA